MVLSSHLVGDLERVCDYLIVLVGSRVRVAGPVEELLASHHLLSGPRRDPAACRTSCRSSRPATPTCRARCWCAPAGPVLDPAWTVSEVGLEDLVLAYMSQAAGRAPPHPPGGAEMIWLTWRQFRAQAFTAAAALAVFAILLAATGPHLASLYAGSGIPGCQARLLGLASTSLAACLRGRRLPHWVLVSVPPRRPGHPPGARDHRPVLGRAADRPRAGDRDLPAGLEPVHHPDPVAGGQARADRPAAMAVTEGLSLMQAWWAAPIGRAVGLGGGALDLRRGPVQLVGLPHPRHHPARLRRVRLHPRRHRRGAGHPARRPGHGRHPGHLRRRPGRHAAVDPPAAVPGPPHDHRGRLAGQHLAPAPTPARRSPPAPSPASPAPGSSPAEPSTLPGSRSAPSRSLRAGGIGRTATARPAAS